MHNTGAAPANPVQVHLFFADTSGTPLRAPDLTAAFWNNFPAGDGPWRLAQAATLNQLASGQPQVARLGWTPPPDTGAEVALLALATHATDNLLIHRPDGIARAGGVLPALVVDPRKPNSLIAADRRAALRIVGVETFTPDPYVRDGLDDQGQGAVAWGGRCTDIVVLEQSTVAGLGDLNTTLADLADKRTEDQLNNSNNYRIFVRVHNRRRVALADVSVRLFALSLDQLTTPDQWTDLGTDSIAAIDPQGWRFSAAFDWNNPPQPGGRCTTQILAAGRHRRGGRPERAG